MKLYVDKLAQHLSKPLAKLYVLSGDEPLQMLEAADAIRAAAKAQGCTEREVLTAETGFEWSDLLYAGASMSLFGERKLIDLRIPNGKPGKNGSEALVEYAKGCANSDDVLLITLPKLDKSSMNTKWMKALDEAGVVMQIWPVEGNQLVGWVAQRLRAKAVQAGNDVAALLAERSEGNLLAAAQEVDKLALLYADKSVSLEEALEAVTDSARFDVYQWVDSLLDGDLKKSQRILEGLKAEGVDAIVANWALARESRQLQAMVTKLATNTTQAVMREFRVWPKRQPIVSQALQRFNLKRCETLLSLSAQVDKEIKGMAPGNPWTTLAQAGVICSKPTRR